MSAPYNPANLAPDAGDNERTLLLKIAKMLYDATLGDVPLQAEAAE